MPSKKFVAGMLHTVLSKRYSGVFGDECPDLKCFNSLDLTKATFRIFNRQSSGGAIVRWQQLKVPTRQDFWIVDYIEITLTLFAVITVGYKGEEVQPSQLCTIDVITHKLTYYTGAQYDDLPRYLKAWLFIKYWGLLTGAVLLALGCFVLSIVLLFIR